MVLSGTGAAIAGTRTHPGALTSPASWDEPGPGPGGVSLSFDPGLVPGGSSPPPLALQNHQFPILNYPFQEDAEKESHSAARG